MAGSQHPWWLASPANKQSVGLIPGVLAPGETEGCWESYLSKVPLQVHMVPSPQALLIFFPSVAFCSLSSPRNTLWDKFRNMGIFLCPTAIFLYSENSCLFSFRHGFLTFAGLSFKTHNMDFFLLFSHPFITYISTLKSTCFHSGAAARRWGRKSEAQYRVY